MQSKRTGDIRKRCMQLSLFLVAEHEIKGTKQGQQRLKWSLYSRQEDLLPKWLQTLLSEDIDEDY